MSGISARAADAQQALVRLGALDELPKTARFVKAQRTALASALGEPKADALASVLEGVASAVSRTRDELVDSLSKLHTFVGHAQDLLAAHRATSGAGNAPQDRATTVTGLFVDVRAMMADALAVRGGRLELHADPEVRGDSVDGVKVLRALVNAIHNAVEACDDAASDRAPVVVVRADRGREGGLHITVTDNGPGFDGRGEALFADGVTTRARGTGLGLGAARRAIASLGGAVRLESDGLGRGATFTVQLPRWAGRRA